MVKSTNTKTITATGTLFDALKRWPLKLAGDKPSQAVIDATGALLKRTGTGKHLALAMYMRPNGCTQPECVAATGDTNVNAYYDAVHGGQLKAITLAPRNGRKVYALTLPKAKARKAKAKSAPKGKPVTTPAADEAGNA